MDQTHKVLPMYPKLKMMKVVIHGNDDVQALLTIRFLLYPWCTRVPLEKPLDIDLRFKENKCAPFLTIL